MIRFRIHRSPEGGDSAGTAVAAAPTETAAKPAEGQAAEASPASTPEAAGTEAPAAKPKLNDWQRYQRMNERFEKNPHAAPTKAELALRAKYEGKDESTIEGYEPPEKPQAEPAAEPQEKPKPEAEKPQAAPVPKELESLIGEKSPIGAKSLADVPKKIENLVQEVKRLNGDVGAVSRVMKEMGARDMREMHSFVRNAAKLHGLVEDLKAGRPEAFTYIGFKGGRPDGQSQGDAPPEILDEGLYRRIAPEIQTLKRENAELRRQLQEGLRDVGSWKEAESRRVAAETRAQQVNDVITDVSTLVQGAPELWDSKTAGSLNAALKEYYSTKSGDAYNPALEPILAILEIAKEHGLDSLEVAHAYWERKNRGSLLQKTREEARRPFTGKAPMQGLSDLQGQHSGQFKEYTKSQLLNMGKPGYPRVPAEWKDESGTLIPERIPAYARAILFEETPED